MSVRRDDVDGIVDAWHAQRPDLDFAPFHVLSRVKRLAKLLDGARRAAFATAGLEAWEFDVLAALRRAGAPHTLGPKALLTQTLVSSGTMTNRIDRLSERGLVDRSSDPNDGRSVLVQLTSEGFERVDRAITELTAAEHQLLDGLTAAEAKRLGDLLRKLGLSFSDG